MKILEYLILLGFFACGALLAYIIFDSLLALIKYIS